MQNIPSTLRRTKSHGCRKDFFNGAPAGHFSKTFPEGPKVVKFVFSHTKLRKQPFFAEIFKIQGAPLPTPMLRAIKWPINVLVGHKSTPQVHSKVAHEHPSHHSGSPVGPSTHPDEFQSSNSNLQWVASRFESTQMSSWVATCCRVMATRQMISSL